MIEKKQLRGIYPILATCFKEDESIDYDSQERLIDYCITNGVNGLVTLANASEGHLLSDEEKKQLLSFVIKKVNGHIPVVVTINHPSSYCAMKMAEHAESEGADAVMCMPPFFGRWRSGLKEIIAYLESINNSIRIPLVLQDHQLSDISLPVDFIITLSNRLENLKYVKLEFGNITHKARKLLAHPQCTLEGVFGGNSGIFLPEEYEAGCCGTMPACYMPDIFSKTWKLLDAGKRDEALSFFIPFSRLASYEKDVANRCLWKIILQKKKVIQCAKTREPVPTFFDEWSVKQFLRLAKHTGIEF